MVVEIFCYKCNSWVSNVTWDNAKEKTEGFIEVQVNCRMCGTPLIRVT